jgi:hypothetical protein
MWCSTLDTSGITYWVTGGRLWLLALEFLPSDRALYLKMLKDFPLDLTSDNALTLI